ncbi:hypothetical protein ACLOJK_029324 [Asimina triloba]
MGRYSVYYVIFSRRDYRGNDLRDRLERRHSPRQRYSPGRDTRGRRAFHGQKPAPYDRGKELYYSLIPYYGGNAVGYDSAIYNTHREKISKSNWREGEGALKLTYLIRHRKKQHLDGQSDVSGSLKMSDDAEDQVREGKHLSYDDKDVLEDQLKQAQLDIEMLDDHKCQLEIFFEEKVQEAETLTSRIEELETQLIKEQEECRRITSKMKKFIKAHNRYSRAQEELKRTQARLQRLGDQLNSETSRFGANEEDSSVNIVSDGEVNEDNRMSPRNDVQNHASTSRKRLRGDLAVGEESKPGLSRRREGFFSGKTKLEKLRSQGPAQVENNIKETEVLDKIPAGNSFRRPPANAIRHKRGKLGSPGNVSLDKVKGSEAGHLLPPTSMAAYAADEFLEANDVEDKVEAGETATDLENGTSAFKAGFPFPPPPPLPKVLQHAYKQYEGDDEDADVEELDVNVRDADINSEVEIEQLWKSGMEAGCCVGEGDEDRKRDDSTRREIELGRKIEWRPGWGKKKLSADGVGDGNEEEYREGKTLSGR